MPYLVAAAYLVPPRRRPPLAPSALAAEFYRVCASRSFPYDIGDDPSFFASKHLGGPITWGVCRADVRRALKPRDWVVFFAAERAPDEPDITSYYLVAALEVDYLTSQTDVVSGKTREPKLHEYLNLLIVPDGDGWRHYEPANHPRDWHKDWLWRICDQDGRAKRDMQAAAARHFPGQPLPVPVANNYVVFSRVSEIRLGTPLLVARHAKGELTESWLCDPLPVEVRRLVFGHSQRGLRTPNRQQPHRHFRRELPEGWGENLRALVECRMSRPSNNALERTRA